MLMKAFDKIGVLTFVIAFLLSILDSVFTLHPLIESVKTVLLIFFGLVAGLLNITEDEEMKALLASIGFLVGQMVITKEFTLSSSLQGLSLILNNLSIFIGMFALALGLKLIIELNSSSFESTSNTIRQSRYWNTIILISIAIAFFSFVLEEFFIVGYDQLFMIINYVLSVIFIIDIYVLYKQYDQVSTFFRESWLDIIAALPFGLIFSTLKLLKLSRVVKVVVRMKPTKLLAAGKGGKVLSKHTFKEHDKKDQ